jgi:hypothetical protein
VGRPGRTAVIAPAAGGAAKPTLSKRSPPPGPLPLPGVQAFDLRRVVAPAPEDNVDPRFHGCLVAEHCWDPVGLAIVEYSYRFERLAASAPGQG